MNIYTLKVTLADSPYAPENADQIWRIIEITGSQTLDHLHRAIFRAFDRWEEHLYSFYLGKSRRDPDPEYTSPFATEDFGLGGPKPRNAKRAKIDDLGLSPRRRFYYLFDFGDSWEHVVQVISIRDREPEGRYPKIVEKHGESPPQYPEDDEDEDVEPDVL